MGYRGGGASGVIGTCNHDAPEASPAILPYTAGVEYQLGPADG